MQVRTASPDETDEPLLCGLPSSFAAFGWHRLQLGRAPDGFVLLGGSQDCPVQLMRHASRPLFGVQFHPEYAGAGRGAGLLVLRNFLLGPARLMKRQEKD